MSIKYLLTLLLEVSLMYLTYILLINIILYMLGSRYENPKIVETSEAYEDVTIIVPTRNEDPKLLSRLLSSIIKLQWPRDKLEVIVIDDSDGENVSKLESVCSNYNAILNVKFIHRSKPRGRKPGALNDALSHAKGNIVVVLDVDCEISPNFLREICSLLKEDKYCYVQSSTKVRTGGSIAGLVNQVMNSYREVVQLRGLNSIGLPLIVGYGYAIKSSILKKLGKWCEEVLTEDVELMYRLFENNYKGVYVTSAKVTYDAPPTLNDLRIQQERWFLGILQSLKKHLLGLLICKRPWYLKLLLISFGLFYTGLLVNLYIIVLPILLELINETLILDTTLSAYFLISAVIMTIFSAILFRICPGKVLKEKIRNLVFTMMLFNALTLNIFKGFMKFLFRMKEEWKITPKVSVSIRTVKPKVSITDILMLIITLLSTLLSLKRALVLFGWNLSLFLSFLFLTLTSRRVIYES